MSWGFHFKGIAIKLVSYFIDGFNVYHALDDDPKYFKYKWLNYAKFIKCFCPPRTNNSQIHISDIYYFTALTFWNHAKMMRHKVYIKALENEGVKTIRGNFKEVDKHCPTCNKDYKTHEEKQTDVNIAIKLFQDAMEDNFDIAIIISGDSDLIPSIQAIKSSFPSKVIGIVIPINRRAEELKTTADFHVKMKEKHLESSMFEDKVTLNDGEILTRPATYI